MNKRARNVLKKQMKKKQGGMQLYGIKQGVGRVTQNPFPKPRRRKRSNKTILQLRHAFNALHPGHLALPRAVGGYSNIVTTDIINSNGEAFLFGTFKGPAAQYSDTTWYNTIAVRPNIIGNAIGGSTNAFFYTSAALSAEAIDGSRMVPAAITVQIMNGAPLQTTSGIVYIGRCKTVLDLLGDPRPWSTLMAELVSYSGPRLCSAAKLALRGVQVNAVPNNLSVLSDFVPRRIGTAGTSTWTEGTYTADFEGFGPIFVYNPDEVPLKYLVTIKWRMRFDPLNPAYAGHVVHAPASESTWQKAIADAEAMGNGVLDIADVAADMGMAAVGAAALL